MTFQASKIDFLEKGVHPKHGPGRENRFYEKNALSTRHFATHFFGTSTHTHFSALFKSWSTSRLKSQVR
jgi:hypothetical protein